jgi:hypothetical protein
MMACPEDLDPKNVCSTNKHQLISEGTKWAVESDPDRADLYLDNRRVPIPRLIRKLGLHAFENKGPLNNDLYRPNRVVLPLKQHAGPAATPTVRAGDRVRIGDVIARPQAGALGSIIHASIDGAVSAVANGSIVIER